MKYSGYFSVIFFLILLLVSGCTKNNSEKLIVGISAEYHPFEFVENGEFKGFDIDLINRISSDLNKKIEFMDLKFSSLFPALNSGQIDLAISAIAITDERKENFDISNSYFSDGIAIIYNKDSEIKGVEELQGKKLATQLGTTMEAWLKKKFTENEIILVDSNNQGIENLKNHIIDAVVVNVSQAKSFTKNSETMDFFIVDDKETNLSYGIVAKKNSDLIPKINKILDNLIDNGEIEKLQKKWII